MVRVRELVVEKLSAAKNSKKNKLGMNKPDTINAAFELFGAIVILRNAFDIWKKKCVAGASLLACSFFWSWGIWNVFYYPHLEQWVSMVCGGMVLIANTVFGILVFKYRSV